MADINNKSIDELQSASAIADADLLVLQQNGVAKSVSGSVVKNFINSKIVEDLPDAVESLGYDYVVENGTSGNWYYKKFAGGTAVMWGTHTVTTSGNAAVGSMYYTDVISVDTPFPVDYAAITASVSDLCVIVNPGYSTSTTSPFVSFRLLRPYAFTGGTATVRLQVWGQWDF